MSAAADSDLDYETADEFEGDDTMSFPVLIRAKSTPCLRVQLNADELLALIPDDLVSRHTYPPPTLRRPTGSKGAQRVLPPQKPAPAAGLPLPDPPRPRHNGKRNSSARERGAAKASPALDKALPPLPAHSRTSSFASTKYFASEDSSAPSGPIDVHDSMRRYIAAQATRSSLEIMKDFPIGADRGFPTSTSLLKKDGIHVPYAAKEAYWAVQDKAASAAHKVRAVTRKASREVMNQVEDAMWDAKRAARKVTEAVVPPALLPRRRTTSASATSAPTPGLGSSHTRVLVQEAYVPLRAGPKPPTSGSHRIRKVSGSLGNAANAVLQGVRRIASRGNLQQTVAKPSA